MNALAAAASGLHWCYIMVVTGGYVVTTLWLHHGYLEAAALAAASARIEVKVVVLVRAMCLQFLSAPRCFFQPLGSSLAYPGTDE